MKPQRTIRVATTCLAAVLVVVLGVRLLWERAPTPSRSADPGHTPSTPPASSPGPVFRSSPTQAAPAAGPATSANDGSPATGQASAPAPPPAKSFNEAPTPEKVARWADAIRRRQGRDPIARIMEWQYRLVKIGPEAVTPVLEVIDQSPSADSVRAAAVRLLGEMGDESLRGRFEAWLSADPNDAVRSNAAWALGGLGGEAARAPLAAARDGDASAAVKKAAEEALRALESGTPGASDAR